MNPSNKPLIGEDSIAVEFTSIHEFWEVFLDSEDGFLVTRVRAGGFTAERPLKPKHARKIAHALLALADAAEAAR